MDYWFGGCVFGKLVLFGSVGKVVECFVVGRLLCFDFFYFVEVW